jgi:translation initiation factor IF-3
LRVIDKDGKQVGVLSLEEALARAREEGIDLVEVAPSANPPVAKLIDFKKFRYEENKKQRLSRRNTHESSTKEVWLGPLMSDHDLDNRIRRAKVFLADGDRVKFTVKFSGREMAHPEFGHRVLEKTKEKLVGIALQDGTPRFLGRNLSVGFLPDKSYKPEGENGETEVESERK